MTLQERIADLGKGQFKYKRKWTFTLEAGHGQTYSSGDPTLYAHNYYPRGSVMAGRPQRVWLEVWDDWESARKALAEIGLKYDDLGDEGSTFIPIDQLTAGLPDEDAA